MEMTAIKNLDITVDDFELISKALDHYTSKNVTGKVLGSVFGAMFTNGDPVKKAAWEKAEAEANRKEEREMDILKEDIRILQSKVIMLKRLLIEHNLMESITPPLTKILAISSPAKGCFLN